MQKNFFGELIFSLPMEDIIETTSEESKPPDSSAPSETSLINLLPTAFVKSSSVLLM